MKKNRTLKKLFAAVFFLYPLLAFLVVRFYNVGMASLLLSFILLLRIFFFREQTRNTFGRVFDAVLWLVLANNLVNLYFKSELALKIYPILMSAGVCGIFLRSLWIRQPLIEKFARLYEKDLSEQRLKYIHTLTVIWTCWLFLNTLISLYTALYANLEFWTLYNSLLFYVICGILFAGDLAYRKFFLSRLEMRNEGHALK